MVFGSRQFSKVDRCATALNRAWFYFSIAVACGISSSVIAASVDEFECGILNPPGQYGPYDYRTATDFQKNLVESGHFTAEVERLQRGTAQVRPGPDIDYTLRALPNHPRALKAMMELAFRTKTDRPFGARWPVECYFNRALRFTPNDPQVRVIYGVFLARRGRKQEAIEQLEAAQAVAKSNGNIQYNLGLVYFQLQDYDKAREHAYVAQDLGFPLEGLQNMLKRAGQWRERKNTNDKDEAPSGGIESSSPAAK